MPDSSAIAAFLKKMHLFAGLNDGQLRTVADSMHSQTYPVDGSEDPDLVFREGTRADGFYVIFSGKVTVTRQVKKRTIKLASLSAGDYFGEQGLLKNRTHNATIRAEKGTVLLIMHRDDFKTALVKVPELRPNFLVMMQCRDMAGRLKFDWLGQDEVIYFIAGKHWLLLLQALVMPLLVLLFSGVVFFIAYLLTSPGFAALGGFVSVIGLALGIWQYIDWGNDFYIVTNKRVIWLEKVIFLYDSRTEAPMTTILSVNTEREYWGRQFNFGTIIVRTFTGQVRMEFVQFPLQAAAMIQEYWDRTKVRTRQVDDEVFKNAIRVKMGKPPLPVSTPPPAPTPAAAPAKKVNPIVKWLHNNFGMRIEAGGVVTYHKHWIILLRDIWMQSLIFISVIVLIIAGLIWLQRIDVYVIAFGLLMLTAAGAWWYYGYEDWKNDLYQLTAEQVIDVYKQPFGMEDRRAAPIDGILGTEYRRSGLLGMLFNYGTVFINVGGSKFDFVDVANPPAVHQDIVERYEARQRKKKEAETNAERDRIVDWLVMYNKAMAAIDEPKK